MPSVGAVATFSINGVRHNNQKNTNKFQDSKLEIPDAFHWNLELRNCLVIVAYILLLMSYDLWLTTGVLRLQSLVFSLWSSALAFRGHFQNNLNSFNQLPGHGPEGFLFLTNFIITSDSQTAPYAPFADMDTYAPIKGSLRIDAVV